MSRDTIQFMMKKILHFESFEDRLIDLEKRNGDLEAHLKIVKNQLDKFTLNNNNVIGETGAPAANVKNPFDDADISANLNHDRRQQFVSQSSTATAPQVTLEDDQVLVSTDHNHDQEQSFNRSTTTSSTVIEIDTSVSGSQDGINAEPNHLLIGAAADSCSNIAENPIGDEMPNQNQSATTSAEAGIISTELNTILNGSQDDNVENRYLDVIIDEIEIKSEPDGNELDCTSNTNIIIDENVESASTGPQITSISISSGKDLEILKSNLNLFTKNQKVPKILQNVIIPLKKVDSDPNFKSKYLSLCPSLSKIKSKGSLNATKAKSKRAAQFSIRTRSHNYKNTRSNSKPKLVNNFTKKSRKCRCKICTKSFTSLMGLYGHMHVHSHKKENKCPICFKSFSRAEQLKIHSQIHREAGEKPFSCSVCPKIFSHKSNLTRHMKWIHNHNDGGLKSFSCPDCPEKFNHKTNLTCHMSIHNGGEKSFKCSDCPKKFAQCFRLVRHKRIHTGEKPFGCQLCPKFFRLKDYLAIHTRHHTGERPYECSTCSKKFIRKSGLNVHKKFVHKKVARKGK